MNSLNTNPSRLAKPGNTSHTTLSEEKTSPHLGHDVDQAFYAAVRISVALDEIIQMLKDGGTPDTNLKEVSPCSILERATHTVHHSVENEAKIQKIRHLLFGS